MPGAGADTMDWPRLTIVTTNFNYGRFVGAAIESVLGQDYPNLEYFVFDAASTDGSADVIRGFEGRLSGWHSRPDSGPSSALNLGLRRASGEWFYYLNSDDVLLPGALRRFALAAAASGPRLWISGGRHEIDAAGALLRRRLPWRDEVHLFALARMWHPAEGTFLHVPSLRSLGLEFDETYKNIFDSVLYTQLDRREPPLYVDAYFGCMRLHGANKSGLGNSGAMTAEAVRHGAALGGDPALARAASRLSRTRFARAGESLLAAAFRAGLAGRRPRLEAAVPEGGGFTVVPIREALARPATP
jgi:hypothetical protein